MLLYTLTVVVITIIAIILTIAVLLQSGQGQGLSGGIAGNMGGATNVLGSRRTADFLSKATAFLGGTFLVLCLMANFFIDRSSTTRSAVQQSGVEMPAPTQSPSAVPVQN